MKLTYQVTIQNIITNITARHRGKYISCFGKVLQVITTNILIIKACMHKVMSAIRANLGPKCQCDLTLRLGSKQFIDSFIFLQELHRNIILEFNWQCNYRIGCNWNVNGHLYITHNKKIVYTSTASSNKEPIFENAGAITLPPRSIFVISVQAPTKLNTNIFTN